jgi:hypothetical protein
MIIGSGVDMPYVNFGIPLALCSFPLAFGSALWISRAHFAGLLQAARESMTAPAPSIHPLRATFPLLFFALILVVTKWFPAVVPHLGIPLLFVNTALLSLLLMRRGSMFSAAEWSIREALPILALLAGIGMFIQILTLTGARGLIVVETLMMPPWLRDVGTALLVPLFGGVSAYGSSSVLGVPLLLAMLDRNDIIVAAALSLLASVGDFLPPTRLAIVLAGQVTDEPRTWPIFKLCIAPALLAIVVAMLMIKFANPLAKLLGLS